jgi:hypothetical protein
MHPPKEYVKQESQINAESGRVSLAPNHYAQTPSAFFSPQKKMQLITYQPHIEPIIRAEGHSFRIRWLSQHA